MAEIDNENEMIEEEVYTLTDEDGNESQFSMLGTMEVDNETYFAFVPVDDEEGEYVILKRSEQEGEEMLVTIDDDEEFDRVAEAFEDEFMDICDLDEDGEEEASEEDEK